MALSPRTRSGKFNGLYEAFHNLGYTIGPLIAGILLAAKSPGALWFAFGGAACMMLISALLLPKERMGKSFRSSVEALWRRDKVFRSGFREFRTLGFLGSYLAFLFFVSALHWGFNSILEPLYAIKLGLPNTVLGLIFAGFTLPFIVVSIVAGQFVDHGKTKRVTLAGLFFMAISTCGFGITQEPIMLFLFSLLHGIGQALFLTALMSMFDILSAYHTKERISGIKIFAESAGYFVGPLMAGLAAGFIGFSSTFVTLGLLTLVFAGVTLFVNFETQNKTA
ncbi:MAG: MFS transporter, DHA1 family, multidrug resistance protein [Parcubacteria group bacterium Greene0416_14]|nr:MAG: MFS transporter, DHA1 family, multidrug resistance protein [Parcubacteria group bacterium Greene0416_14]